MTNFVYNRGIPNGPNNPSNDQPKMQINTNSSEDIWDVDHFGFNNNQGGYHDIIHQPPVLTDPTPITGIQQIYVKNETLNASTDTQLYSMSGLGGISQLTGYAAHTNGYQRLGGVTIQWGFVNGTHSGATFNAGDSSNVSFSTSPNFNFLTEVYSVWTQPLYNITVPSTGSGMATIGIDQSTLNTSGFKWTFITGSGSWTKFFWIAIGS